MWDITGKYEVASNALDQEDVNGPCTITLSPTSHGTHLWGRFDFGVLIGYMRSSKLSSKKKVASGHTVSFIWRGSDTSEGQMSYGPKNVVKVTFLDKTTIKGEFNGSYLGKHNFVGSKGPRGNVVWSKSIPGWKEEYYAHNDEAYESQNASRWGGSGGWGYRSDVRQETNSDTASGEEFSEEESEDDGEGPPRASTSTLKRKADDPISSAVYKKVKTTEAASTKPEVSCFD